MRIGFLDYLDVATAVVVRHRAGKTSLGTSISYSVDIFSYSGPSGILGSDGELIPLKLVLGGKSIVALSISSHEHTQLNRVCCFCIL